MESITLEEFWKSERKISIHCNTKIKAKKLLNAFDKMGMRWNSGDRYSKFDLYFDYGKNTCYLNDHRFGSYDYCKNNGYKIYEYEEVDDILLKE